MGRWKNYRAILDLHQKHTQQLVVFAGMLLLCVLALLVRKSLVSFQNPDYVIFAHWYDIAKQYGVHCLAFGANDGFSNYNPTYTYFLYLASILPVSKIVAIKGLIVFFDLVMAAAVYYVVKYFRPTGYAAIGSALATLFLPTVLFNGVLWGQFDDFYVAFVLFSLGAALRSNSKLAWAFFGIAISIKLQAIFFLPTLGLMSFRKIHWHDFMYGIGSFAVLTLIPAFFGRSVSSLLAIYPDQAKLFNGQLTLSAPNIYQWFPNSAFHALNGMGIYLAFAVTLGILLYGVHHKLFSDQHALLAAALFTTVIPYVLPAMHERYFFPATIMTALLMFAVKRTLYVAVAVAVQVIIVLAYCPFLFGTAPISFAVLAVATLAVVLLLLREFITPSQVKAAAPKHGVH